MSDNKYYTPTIEEFHVGFEYELKIGFSDGTIKSQEDFDDAEWESKIVSVGDLPYIERSLNGMNAKRGICGIRVELLDKEDIESLGWKHVQTKSICKEHYEANFEKGSRGKMLLDHDLLNNKITIKTPNYIRDASGDFDGYIMYVEKLIIKNKSEFKRLSQQLNVI